MSWLLIFLRWTLTNFYCRAPRWNPVRTINLRLNFTWFKKFQISAHVGNCNGLAMTKRSVRNLKEFGSRCHATLVTLLCKNVLRRNRSRWLYWLGWSKHVLQPLWEPFQGVTASQRRTRRLKTQDLIATDCSVMTSAWHNLKSYKVNITGNTV